MFGKKGAALLIFAFAYCATNGIILSLIESGDFSPGSILIWIIIVTPFMLSSLGMIIQFEIKEKHSPIAAITYATLMILVSLLNAFFFFVKTLFDPWLAP